MKILARNVLLSFCFSAVSSFAFAGDIVEVHGIIEQSETGMILVTDASSYQLRGIDASGLEGHRAIVLGDEGIADGQEYIDAMQIKIAYQ